MKEVYIETVVMIERLHRLFLEIVKMELDQSDNGDINNVQAMILYNIGKAELTVGQLSDKGCYLGSNVSYNLRKMVQNGYIIQRANKYDKRSFYVTLSPKGLRLYEALDSAFGTHLKTLLAKHIDFEDILYFAKNLTKLETAWISLFKINPQREIDDEA